VDTPQTAFVGHERLDAERMRRISVASVIGTTIEWYDLFLFGTASALVFSKVFFPELGGATGTLLSFLTFAAAYVARMVGAILFGHFGDRLGRKSMLLTSLITMGVATFAIGLVPDYHAIGVAAPFILLTLRIIQGLALGGEWGGAVLMTVEHSPVDRRGFFGSMVQIGVPIGTLLANLAFLIIASNMSEEALLTWGWRIPFLISAALVAFGIYIRLSIEETPAFKIVRETGAKAKIPFANLMRKYWKQVLLGGIATLSTGSTFTLLTTLGLSYGTAHAGFSRTEMLVAVMVACLAAVVLIPYFGALSDRVGRRPIILAGITTEAVLAFPLFWMIGTGNTAWLIIGYVLMMVAFSANYGPIATFLAELFGAKVRYSGLSVAYMLSGLLGSATTPVATTALLNLTGSASAVAWYAVGAATLSVIALVLLSETRNGDIDAVDTPPVAETTPL
jgi:MFS family permease